MRPAHGQLGSFRIRIVGYVAIMLRIKNFLTNQIPWAWQPSLGISRVKNPLSKISRNFRAVEINEGLIPCGGMWGQPAGPQTSPCIASVKRSTETNLFHAQEPGTTTKQMQKSDTLDVGLKLTNEAGFSNRKPGPDQQGVILHVAHDQDLEKELKEAQRKLIEIIVTWN